MPNYSEFEKNGPMRPN